MVFQRLLFHKPVIAWFSGGITSAVTCKLCLDYWPKDSVRVVFMDTGNEDEDTYRFKADCERLWGITIETIRNEEYNNIDEVWDKYESLNVATGAICSTDLKRKVRETFQKKNTFSYGAFGYECEPKEIKRAKAMKINHPDAKPIFPLIWEMLTKPDCIKIIQDLGIEPPRSYKWGFQNNNCLKTGCVQGGIGYWQKMQKDFPDKFEKMAAREHRLTDKKGQPVTMLKDQGKDGGLVFLKPHPMYPFMKDISMMKGRPVEPLMECNGFCGINDLLPKNETETEINYQQ